MAFSNVKLIDQKADIMNEFPYIYFSVSAKALIFRPQIGMKMKGIVNKVDIYNYNSNLK